MTENASQPLVSIGIPVYNGEEFLEECLESILNQTYTNWICNINNNCSTDRTLEIAKSFVKRDSRFTVKTNENFVELVPNWNLAYINSDMEAKYFKIVQADDWIYPEHVEKMVEVFEKNENLSFISSYRIDANRILPHEYHELIQHEVIEGRKIMITHLEKELDILGNITTILLSNEYLRKLDRYPKIFDEDSYHIDTELALDLANLANVGFVPQILSYERLHKKSGTSTVVNKIGTLYQHYDLVLEKYKSNSPTLQKLYKKNRVEFAYAFFLMRFLNKKKALEWHKKHPHAPFTFRETISGIITCNLISKLISKIMGKVGSKIKF